MCLFKNRKFENKLVKPVNLCTQSKFQTLIQFKTMSTHEQLITAKAELNQMVADLDDGLTSLTTLLETNSDLSEDLKKLILLYTTAKLDTIVFASALAIEKGEAMPASFPKAYDPKYISRTKYISEVNGQFRVRVPRKDGTRSAITTTSLTAAVHLRNEMLQKEWNPNYKHIEAKGLSMNLDVDETNSSDPDTSDEPKSQFGELSQEQIDAIQSIDLSKLQLSNF